MPLNSNTKWTANCNTTCRLLLALLLALVLAVPAGAEPAAAPGDILLLHGEATETEELDSLRVLADTATALGYGMEIAAWDGEGDIPAGYRLVICYAPGADAALSRRLLESDAKILLLGGELLPLCREEAAAVKKAGTKGVLQYSFSESSASQAIVPLPETLYRLEGPYESGALETGAGAQAFCAGDGLLRYIPITALTDDLVRGALAREISAFLQPDAAVSSQKGTYLVLDAVYAYIPAQALLQRVDCLIAAGQPFAISVNPTFQNGDYPAMDQFCQVLRYAQANGGTVLLRVPPLREEPSDWTQFRAQMSGAVETLTAHGVFPLGYDVPYSWLWTPEALDWMAQCRTVFVHGDAGAPAFTRETTRNLACGGNTWVLPGLALDGDGENAGGLFLTCQRFPVSDTPEQLEALLAQAKGSGRAYPSLRDSAQRLETDSQTVLCQSGAVTLNGQPQSLSYTPEPYPENYDYQRNVLKRFTVNIQKQSHFLIGLVAVATVVFVGMILYARARARRHFFQAGKGRYVPAHARKKGSGPVRRRKKHIPAHARKKRRN